MKRMWKKTKPFLAVLVAMCLMMTGTSPSVLAEEADSVETSAETGLSAEPVTGENNLGTAPEDAEEAPAENGGVEGTGDENTVPENPDVTGKTDEAGQTGDVSDENPDSAGEIGSDVPDGTESGDPAVADPAETDVDPAVSGEPVQGEEEVEYFWLGATETSAESWSTFVLPPEESVELNSGAYVKWIDRVNLPQYGLDLYKKLEEAISGNGILTDAASGEQSIEIVSFEGETSPGMNVVLQNVRAVFDAFDRDHPEVFWLTGESVVRASMSTQTVGGVQKKTTTYTLLLKGTVNYTDGTTAEFDVRKPAYRTAGAIKQTIGQRDQAVAGILAGIPGDASGAGDKITYFNKWLTENNDYNSSVAGGGSGAAESAWECISALFGKSGAEGPVCEGYARALKVLCDRSGIPCVLVDGMATNSSGNGEAHMWNYVQADDGNWYAVDVTWNDPVISGGGTLTEAMQTAWLLVGSDTEISGRKFIESHPVSNRASGGGVSFTNGPALSQNKFENVKLPVPAVTFGTTEASSAYTGNAVADSVISAPAVTIDGDAVTDAVISYAYRKSGTADAYVDGLPTDAGSYDIKAKVAGKADEYKAAESTNTLKLTITPAALTITAGSQSISYGGTIAQNVSNVTVTGDLLGGTLKSIALTSAGKDVGDYALTPGGAVIEKNGRTVTGNYNITYTPGTLTIAKASLTVKAKHHTITYGEAPASGGVEYSGFVNGEDANVLGGTVSYTYNYTQFGNVGTYEIIPAGFSSTNYNITYGKGTLTVSPRSVTLNWQNTEDRIYGDGKTVTATAGNLVNGDVISVTVTGGDAQSVGSHTATASGLTGDKAGNYVLPKENTKVYEVKKSATTTSITTDKAEYIYGESITITATVSIDNPAAAAGSSLAEGKIALFAGDTQVGEAVAVDAQGRGTIVYQTSDKKLDPGSQKMTVRYLGTESLAGSSGESSVTIKGKPVTVTFSGTVTKAYDGTTVSDGKGLTPEFSGLLTGDIVTVSAVYAFDGAMTGSHKVTVSNIALTGTDGKWYTVSNDSAEGDWGEITRRPVTVTADARNKVYGAADPALTYQVSGIVEGETLNGSLKRVEGETVLAGGYAIEQGTLTDANNPNYTIHYVGAALYVTARPVALEWNGEFESIYDGKQHGVTASVKKDELLGNDVAEVAAYENNTAVNAGIYQARAMSLSNPNYTVDGVTSVKEWKIAAKDISGATVVLESGKLIYDGKTKIKRVVSVTLPGENGGEPVKLTAGTDYLVTGDINVNAGNYTLYVNGTGNYTGSVACAYTIAKADKPVNTPAEKDLNILITDEGDGLESVKLPEGWVWEDPETEVVPGGKVKVTAVREDAENYESGYKVDYWISKEPDLIQNTDYEYEIREDGKAQKSYHIGRDEGVVIHTTGALDRLQKVQVDGRDVDSKDYTLRNGSTILTFTKAYMDKLSVGEHSVKLSYEVGSVEVIVKVSETKTETGTETDSAEENKANGPASPKTGEEGMVMIYLIPLFAALAAASAMAGRKRNKK